MVIFPINRILLTSIPQIFLFRALKSTPFCSSASIYLTHLQKNSSNTERALSRVKAKIDTSAVKHVLNKLSPNQYLLGLRFFIWAGVQSNYRHTSYMYAKGCTLFRMNENPKLVFDLIEVYRQEGILITVKMFQIVLNLCGEANLADEALWVLSKMKELNIRPDTTVYNVVIRLLCEKGSVDVASELMREMCSVNIYPDMVTYITMIKYYCNLGRLEDASLLFKVMKEHGCVPNSVVYSVLLDGICRSGSLEKALELLKEMERESEDCRPNVVTYTTIIQGFCERGRSMESLSVLDRMEACGCVPNRVTVSVLIKGFCTEGLLEEAYKLIERVICEGGVTGGECYSSLVISLTRIGNFEEAEKLFRKMLVSEIKPDGLASSIMLKGLCSKGKVLDAFGMYIEIEKSGYLVSIDSNIYSILLDGLCREHHIAEVIELARLCVNKNIQLKAPYMRYIVEYLTTSGQEEIVSLLTSTKE